MVMAILSFAHGCPVSLNPAQLVDFMKIPEKGRYIMVCNLLFELFASSKGAVQHRNDRERRSLRLLNDRQQR
jgi:hypothetical protein